MPLSRIPKLFLIIQPLEETYPNVKWKSSGTPISAQVYTPHREWFTHVQALEQDLGLVIHARNKKKGSSEEWELFTNLYFPNQNKSEKVEEYPFEKGMCYFDRVKNLVVKTILNLYDYSDEMYEDIMRLTSEKEALEWQQKKDLQDLQKDLEATWKMIKTLQGQ